MIMRVPNVRDTFEIAAETCIYICTYIHIYIHIYCDADRWLLTCHVRVKVKLPASERGTDTAQKFRPSSSSSFSTGGGEIFWKTVRWPAFSKVFSAPLRGGGTGHTSRFDEYWFTGGLPGCAQVARG